MNYVMDHECIAKLQKMYNIMNYEMDHGLYTSITKKIVNVLLVMPWG